MLIGLKIVFKDCADRAKDCADRVEYCIDEGLTRGF